MRVAWQVESGYRSDRKQYNMSENDKYKKNIWLEHLQWTLPVSSDKINLNTVSTLKHEILWALNALATEINIFAP